jgi:uncharacterized protein (TIGR02677 family)
MPPSTGQIRAFAYLTAEKAALYRAVLGAFMQAKERFLLHLRPREISAAVVAGGRPLEPGELEAALGQLCDWGNLEAHPDTAEVATVEDFYRPRFLYGLTAEGEAAENAVRVFQKLLIQPGELQTAALADIRALLKELITIAQASPLDESRLYLTLQQLCSRLEELTSRAQVFLRSLQRTIDLQGISVEAFLAYKERLIDYLERFIGELVVSGGEIAEGIERLEASGVEPLLQAAARRELADSLDATDETRHAALDGWRSRWLGLRAWFLGSDEEPSQAEVLRARARAAIPALLAAVATINDRRLTRTDRAADWRTLARWFATLDDERDAHRLWRAATALPPARHLYVDEKSLERWEIEDTGAQQSWLEAPPLKISLRLRATGRYTRRGRLNDVVDHSEEKLELARIARLEAEQLEKAQRFLARGERLRLSQLGKLDPTEFGLLLDLLGEALAARARPEESAEATSSDGGLCIHLEPILDPASPIAEIEVEGLGCLRGPDCFVTIRRLGASSEEAAA